MSGGHFNYAQDRLVPVIEELDSLIQRAKSGDDLNLSKLIISRIKEAKLTTLLAQEMIQRIDWLISGDDGGNSFHKKWNKNILKIKGIGEVKNEKKN